MTTKVIDAGDDLVGEGISFDEETPPPKKEPKRKREDKTKTTPRPRAKAAPKKTVTVKRTRVAKPGFFIVCPDDECIGVICAPSAAEAGEILAAESPGATVTGDMLMPLSLDAEFCYPLSMGRPEPPRGAAASRGVQQLFFVQDFDYIPGFRGSALVVAEDDLRAITLTDAYLEEGGFKKFAEKEYGVSPVPKEMGYFGI
jgi:hypothetical protein